MPTQLQLRRGTTTEHSSFSGAVGEVTVDTNKDTLIVHDGATNGGFPLAKETGTTFGNNDVSGTLSFEDDSKVVFGDASDLEIYHDGSNSRIAEAGAGDLKIGTSGGAVRITANGVTDDMIVANQGGAVTLSYSGTTKIATTTTGVDITGGFDATAGSTITTDDNTTQLTLQSNDDGATEGPRLDLRRNSASPADGDVIGTVRYNGENSDGTNLVFAEIKTMLSDVSAGTVDSSLNFFVRRNNTLTTGLSLDPQQAVFNEAGNDVDFRVESDGQANALFLNGNTSNFGINRSPTYELDVGANDTDGSVSGRIIAGTDSGASAIFRVHTQATAGARTSSLYFGDSANGGIGRVEYYHADDSMRFNTNNTERVRILAGGGLTFNGDTAAANALDDYEEGTWTPAPSTSSGSNSSFGSATGKYVKIGRLVFITAVIENIDTTNTTAGSQLRVIGFPFTIDEQSSIGSMTWNNITTPYNQANPEANTSEYILFRSSNPDADNTRQVIDHQHLVDDVSDIQFSITYHTDQ